MNPLRFLLIPATIVALAGCAPIASVTVRPPQFASVGAAGTRLASATKIARREPLTALATNLTIAREAAETLQREPGSTLARGTYNLAVARSIEIIDSANLDPWSRPLAVPGAGGGYVISTRRNPESDYDPAHYTLVPADTLEVGGRYFTRRVAIEGLGAPIVAIGKSEHRDHRKRFAPKRLYADMTAIIRFEGRRAVLEFFNPLDVERVTLNGRNFPLAADFSAALAKNLQGERPDKLGLIRLLRPDRYADTARLVRLQPYDPHRIPVIFTHGLQDTPASWTPMINELRAYPEIRRRYQFWAFSYPSGYPYPYSAALMRRELEAAHEAFPGHQPFILVGHSMGSLLSRLMVTDAGEQIWNSFFSNPPGETRFIGRTGELLEESIVFDHLPFVSRVIFIAAPHRGSELASNWIGRMASRLVRAPTLLADLKDTLVSIVTIDPAAITLDSIPNSVDTLSPNNRFVREINKIPIVPGIPFHSIIGDRGRGNTPDSSDGVVPYSSSHLEGAQSERVVPSGHSAHQHPQGIAEVRRILGEHR